MKTRLIIISIILLTLTLGVMYYFTTGSYSDGFRAGTLVKFSKKGVAFKTYEGELNLGMVLSDQASTGSVWKFSVENDPTLVKKMEEALLSGKRVKLHYTERFFTFPWEGDSKYYIKDIQVVQ